MEMVYQYNLNKLLIFHKQNNKITYLLDHRFGQLNINKKMR